MIVNGINEKIVYTDNDVPVEPILEYATPVKLRIALTQLNLRTQFQNAGQISSQDIKDWWDYETEFNINDENFNGLLNTSQSENIF